MTSPLSVLLIIGSAVLGPIEAQTVTDWDSPIMSERNQTDLDAACVRMNQDTQAAEACKKMVVVRTESISELCDRAMREIGANLFIQGLPDDATAPRWYAMGRQSNGERVRCIPVPTGYKR